MDDTTISDDEVLWRRIHPTWCIPNENAGGMRVSSAAFADSADGSPLSVLLADVVAQTNRVAQDVIAGYDGYALAAITARTARSAAQVVARTPEPDEPAHASIFGKKTQSARKRIAKEATWVIVAHGDR